jgi:2-dehydro-3-deoxyphosphogluconate aldolase/(4S)-4-hydroxy-2-oxoglutarate aldolase
MPTGGINIDNLAEFLAYDRIIACGGSWMVSAKLINAGQFDEITRLSAQAVAAAAPYVK